MSLCSWAPITAVAFNHDAFGDATCRLCPSPRPERRSALGRTQSPSPTVQFPFPFPHPRTGTTRHDYRGLVPTFTCLVMLSVLAHEKNLVPSSISGERERRSRAPG